MFKTRLISGIILVAIALLTMISGGYVLYGTILGISLIGLDEYYRAVGMRSGEHSQRLPLALTGYAFLLVYYLVLGFGWQQFSLMILVFGMIAFLCVYVFRFPKYRTEEIAMAYFGVIYTGVMLSFVYLTRCLEHGAFLVWLILMCSWGCDTCAYCVGMLIGKHKMSPVLSPKKSIEGAVGGVIGAALIGAAYAAIIQKRLGLDHAVLIFSLICAVGALISMVGDLAASAIKRNHEIKDYGTLIPGHGGILDRFDSVIFTAPVIYFLAVILIG